MQIRWQDARTDVVETLDRLFDKGVVVDPWARAASRAIDLVHEDRRVIVVSVEVYPERRVGPGV